MVNKGNRIIWMFGAQIESINERFYKDMQMQVFSDIVGINQ